MCSWERLFCQYMALCVFRGRAWVVPCRQSSLSSDSRTGPVSGKCRVPGISSSNIITLQLSLKAFWERVSSWWSHWLSEVVQGFGPHQHYSSSPLHMSAKVRRVSALPRVQGPFFIHLAAVAVLIIISGLFVLLFSSPHGHVCATT